MSYQILPNIIFIFAVLGILLIILRHLPEATENADQEHHRAAQQNLSSKGLPTEGVSAVQVKLKVWTKKWWNFVLEAKDLKPTAVAGYKIKKIFREKQKLSEAQAMPPQTEQPESQPLPQARPATSTPPKPAEPVKDERYFLEAIKREPKNLENYDHLGKYYIDHSEFGDCKDIYLYLVGHQPTNATYQARLAYSYFRLKTFQKAVEHYRKSLSLDNSQPNRYYNLGLSLEAYGDKSGSIEAFEKAIALEPKNIKFYTTLASLLAKYGHRDKAKNLLGKAKQIDPANQDIQSKLRELS